MKKPFCKACHNEKLGIKTRIAAPHTCELAFVFERHSGNYQKVTSVNDGLFNTVSGEVVSIDRPTIHQLHILDIANALSKICRFGGHVDDFYSVAQHSVLVAAMAPFQLRKAALLHDASEAYLGDIIKPLKVKLRAYNEIEDRFQSVIAQLFDIPEPDFEQVKYYDIQALEIEHQMLQRGRPANFRYIMNDLRLPGRPLLPNAARALFMSHYYRLFTPETTTIEA